MSVLFIDDFSHSFFLLFDLKQIAHQVRTLTQSSLAVVNLNFMSLSMQTHCVNELLNDDRCEEHGFFSTILLLTVLLVISRGLRGIGRRAILTEMRLKRWIEFESNRSKVHLSSESNFFGEKPKVNQNYLSDIIENSIQSKTSSSITTITITAHVSAQCKSR